MWSEFDDLYQSYKKMKYTYKIKLSNNELIFKEFSNRKLVRKLSIDDKITILLLKLLQHKVYSFEEFFEEINNELENNLSELGLKKIITELHKEGIIYYTSEYKCITTNIIL